MMDIQHDMRQQKFFTIVKGEEYSLEYNQVDDHLWEFHCPLFKQDLRTHEIIDQLIEYALFYIKRNNIRLLENGSCMQVKEFLERKRELEFLVIHNNEF